MSKPMSHSARRERFLAAAYRMIQKKGMGGATVRAIAKEAGFTTGALVHYIKSVDELLVEASEFAARAVRTKMEVAERLPNKVEALRQVLYLALCTDADKRGNWNVRMGFWERSLYSSVVRRIIYARYQEWLDRTARLIGNAKQAGELPDDVNVHRAARACVALIDGLAIQVLRSGISLPPAEQRELMDEWISNWLRPLRSGSNQQIGAQRSSVSALEKPTSTGGRASKRRAG